MPLTPVNAAAAPCALLIVDVRDAEDGDGELDLVDEVHAGGVLRHHAHEETEHGPPTVVDLVLRGPSKHLRILHSLVVRLLLEELDHILRLATLVLHGHPTVLEHLLGLGLDVRLRRVHHGGHALAADCTSRKRGRAVRTRVGWIDVRLALG